MTGSFKSKYYYHVWSIYIDQALCNGSSTSVDPHSVSHDVTKSPDWSRLHSTQRNGPQSRSLQTANVAKTERVPDWQGGGGGGERRKRKAGPLFTNARRASAREGFFQFAPALPEPCPAKHEAASEQSLRIDSLNPLQ